MKNSKFRKAARLRKVSALFLTMITFLGLIGIIFFQSDLDPFSEIGDFIANIIFGETEETSSVNYP